jgi:hypothetical protein
LSLHHHPFLPSSASCFIFLFLSVFL